MKIIGVTGNIGSGKSEISKYLKIKNYFIIDADKIGHSVLLKDGNAYKEVLNYFGNNILNKDYTINRKVLGKIVFSNEEKLNALTTITHKYIIKNIKCVIEERKKINIDSYIVIDAALLIEANLHEICDYVFVVVANLKKRIERIIVRDNINKDIAIQKINTQKTNEQLIPFATNIINNNGSLDNLYEQIETILKNIESRS